MKEGGQAPNPRLLHLAEPGRSSMHRGQKTLYEQRQPDFPDPGDALLRGVLGFALLMNPLIL